MREKKKIKAKVSTLPRTTALVNESEREWHIYENEIIWPIRIMTRILQFSINCDEISKKFER